MDYPAMDPTRQPLSHIVMRYTETLKRIVDDAKQTGFTMAQWAPLSEMVAVDEFERVGNFLERMNWQQYIEMLTRWATVAGWGGTFRRITEVPGRVFLELEERSTIGDQVNVVNSVSVYEFDDAGKLRHLDIYLQAAGVLKVEGVS